MRPLSRSLRAVCVVLAIAAAGALVGCNRSREVRLDLRWDLTDTGACKTASEGAGEKEITFRYTKAPDHFETVCSNRIASHLLAGGVNPVPAMFLYYPGTKGRSLCEIDVIKATRVGGPNGESCTQLGHAGGGTRSVGSATASPSPFETP